MVAQRLKPWILPVLPFAFCVFVCGDFASSASAQDGRPVRSSGRRLSADAIYTIAPGGDVGDTVVGPLDLPFLPAAQGLAWTPPTFPDGKPNYASASATLLEMSKNVTFHHDIYSFELTFKPVRMIAVDLPDEKGEMVSKLVWYFLYRVRYLGNDLKPKAEPDQYGNNIYPTAEPTSEAPARRFLPTFSLTVPGLNGSYPAQLIPQAIAPIAEKERIGKPLHDSIQIQTKPIPLSNQLVSNEVWGVATWVGVDPRTNFFTVEVTGLTNAQKVDPDSKEINLLQKTLVLNFSRPGDTINELADEIRYGVPASEDPAQQAEILRQYGLQERLDHYWVYR